MHAGGSLLQRRVEFLETQFRRRLRAAIACAVFGHALFAFLPAWPRLGARAHEVPTGLGFEGPDRLVDLGPPGEAAEDQAAVARRRLAGGALEAQALPREPWLQPADLAPVSPTGEYPPPADRRLPDIPAILELGEDWSAPAKSAEHALSSQFQIVRIVRPEYPPAAVRAGIDGLVELEVDVDHRGLVREVRVRSGPPRGAYLEEASVEAIRQWAFKPLQRNGRPVSFTVIVPFRYRFEN
jgi:TonB family protein